MSFGIDGHVQSAATPIAGDVLSPSLCRRRRTDIPPNQSGGCDFDGTKNVSEIAIGWATLLRLEWFSSTVVLVSATVGAMTMEIIRNKRRVDTAIISAKRSVYAGVKNLTDKRIMIRYTRQRNHVTVIELIAEHSVVG